MKEGRKEKGLHFKFLDPCQLAQLVVIFRCQAVSGQCIWKIVDINGVQCRVTTIYMCKAWCKGSELYGTLQAIQGDDKCTLGVRSVDIELRRSECATCGYY